MSFGGRGGDVCAAMAKPRGFARTAFANSCPTSLVSQEGSAENESTITRTVPLPELAPVAWFDYFMTTEITDTDRLNWLDAEPDRYACREFKAGIPPIWYVAHRNDRAHHGNTLREAIDAAMAYESNSEVRQAHSNDGQT